MDSFVSSHASASGSRFSCLKPLILRHKNISALNPRSNSALAKASNQSLAFPLSEKGNKRILIVEVYKWIVLALSISLDFWLRWLVHEA
jgi:hypothetical protein